MKQSRHFFFKFNAGIHIQQNVHCAFFLVVKLSAIYLSNVFISAYAFFQQIRFIYVNFHFQ